MTKNTKFISKLQDHLIKRGHQVSAIEMTAGNYDEQSNLIVDDVPTVTTELCEVGAYNGYCYFTVILKSSLFTRKLFGSIAKYPRVQIYGLRKFQTNYYPKDNFVYNEFEGQVISEEFVQIQFNFDTISLSTDMIYKKYLEVASMFKVTKIEVENQLARDFTKGTNE